MSQLGLKKLRYIGTQYFFHQFLPTYNKHLKEVPECF